MVPSTCRASSLVFSDAMCGEPGEEISGEVMSEEGMSGEVMSGEGMSGEGMSGEMMNMEISTKCLTRTVHVAPPTHDISPLTSSSVNIDNLHKG